MVPRTTWAAVILLLAAIGLVEGGVRPAVGGSSVEVATPGFAVGVVEKLRGVPLLAIEDPRAAAVASGVIFGRTEHVAPSEEHAFLSSGLWHLLAASGQNVALVAGCCVLFARAVGAGRTTGSVLALAAIPAYVVVVGGGASIVRAGAMGMIAVTAWLAGRLPDVRHVIVVVAAATCWLWPGAHRGLGMQLSFACVAALAWAAPPLARALAEHGVPRPMAGAIAATLLCSAATAPILYLRTGTAPLVGIAANVVAVPLAACLLVSGLTATVLAAALGPVAPALADVLLLPAGLLAGALVQVAHRAAALPAAQTSSPLLALGLPALWLLWSRRRFREGRARPLLLAAACVCLLVPTTTAALRAVGVRIPIGGAPGPIASGGLRVAVLDVGQGDATLVATQDRALLVDTGPPDGDVVGDLRRLGVERVDGIVLTHDSLDHRGGFEHAVAALEPGWVAVPRAAPGPWRRVRERAPRTVELCAGDQLALAPDVVLDVLHPRCDGMIEPRTDDLHNDGAMVLLARHRDVRALLPADAESPVLLELGLPPLSLLRVAHHGSADAQLPTLLDRTAPAVAAISAGSGNGYGHPHPDVLRALRERGVRTTRTDTDGTLVFDSDGTVLRVVRGA